MTEAAQLAERRDDLAESVEGLAVYAEKDRAIAGVIVTIGDDGEFRLHEGLVDLGGEDDATETDGDSDDAICEHLGNPARTLIAAMIDSRSREASGSAPTVEQTVRKECGFSQLLVDDLKAHRLQITKAHLAGDFGVAFDLALYALCVDLFERFGYRPHPLDLRAIEARLHNSFNDLAGSPADGLLEAHKSTLDFDWLKLRPAEGFAALAALPTEAKQRLFARCIALCLKPQLAIKDGVDPVIEATGRRLAIPLADYWRPTAANYRSRVKKAHGLAIEEEGNPRRSLGSRSRGRQKAGTRRGVGNCLRSREKRRLHRSRPGGARRRCVLAAARHGLCRRCRGRDCRSSCCSTRR